MWPRWNPRPMVVHGFSALPAAVVSGPQVAGTAPFIRVRDAVSAATRGRSAVSDVTAAQLLWVHRHSVAAGAVSPRGRPPPPHQAPSEASPVWRRRYPGVGASRSRECITGACAASGATSPVSRLTRWPMTMIWPTQKKNVSSRGRARRRATLPLLEVDRR